MSAKPDRDPRPPGLTTLAVFNFMNFLAACVYLVVLFAGGFRVPPGTMNTVLACVSGMLAAVSAVGFLLRHMVLGYYLGNVFGVFLLIYALAILSSRGSVNPLEYFAWLSYPVILLLALNLLYRREFEPAAVEL